MWIGALNLNGDTVKKKYKMKFENVKKSAALKSVHDATKALKSSYGYKSMVTIEADVILVEIDSCKHEHEAFGENVALAMNKAGLEECKPVCERSGVWE